MTAITVVYDNRLYDKNLKTGHGFSCLIEQPDKKILFDTGNDSGRLAFNLDSLGIKPENLDTLVLSHSHGDHAGGLDAVFEKSKKSIVYIGKAFSQRLKNILKKKGANYVKIGRITSIAEGVFIGPEMRSLAPPEIPLTLEINKSLVIITGCAHPGIVNVVKKIKGIFNKEIYLVLGGFHLEFSIALKKIAKQLKELGVAKVAPCHCTGERAIDLFKQEFKESFIKAGAGLKLEIN